MQSDHSSVTNVSVAEKSSHQGPRPWLRRLGIFGMDQLQAPLLAALATELPLLLIGPHGTAKSLLLTRMAQALQLRFRHYNASLIHFDDLIGFPMPASDGGLQYLQTPATIWDAQAVFLDEISRCRPEMQNKLFPIIHERKVQGIDLKDLQFRWAAMNPPQTEDEALGYRGSEVLDRALADRFAFILAMPAWEQFSREDRLAVIQSGAAGNLSASANRSDASVISCDWLKSLIGQTRDAIEVLRVDQSEKWASYIETLTALLANAKIALSPRRAAMLYEAVIAVLAASVATDAAMNAGDAAWLALRSCLPQHAEGVLVPEVKLLAAHREAMRSIKLGPHDPLRAIVSAGTPLKRLRLAVSAAGQLPKAEFSRVIADALAQMKPGEHEAAVVYLFESGAVGRLHAAVATQAGDLYQELASAQPFSITIHASSGRYAAWGRVKDLLARLDPEKPQSHLQANAMASLFKRKQLASIADADAAFAAYAAADGLLRTLSWTLQH